MDQDDEYYHNAKNRHEMYSLKEGDHVIGEFIKGAPPVGPCNFKKTF